MKNKTCTLRNLHEKDFNHSSKEGKTLLYTEFCKIAECYTHSGVRGKCESNIIRCYL